MKYGWLEGYLLSLPGAVPDDLLRELCADSYRLILEKLPKYAQKEIENS